jgi:hypothetical protein
MDIKTNVPFDGSSFAAQVQSGATINAAEGWVQNINQAAVQQRLADYQTQVAQYISAQKPGATVGDVIGTQTVSQDNRSILAGTLPYARIATGARFQVMPDNLRWKFRYNVYASDMDRALDDPFISFTSSTAAIAGKRLTLSFSAATQADQATIDSLLPPPHPDGTPIQPGELPQSLPGYLIRMVPKFRLAGEVVASGPAFTMGTELIQNAAYFNPATGQWDGQGGDNHPTVADYIATGLDLQGAAPGQLESAKSKLSAVQDALTQLLNNPTDTTSISTLGKDDVVGELLNAGIVAYFAGIDNRSKLGAAAAEAVTVRMPSFGNFGLSAQTIFSFGVPRSVKVRELNMDVDRVFGADVRKDGNNSKLVDFRKNMGGQMSALENLIPEELFTDLRDPNRAQAVSAVKAIGIAASQGQRIYHLDLQNQDLHSTILSQLAIDAAVKEEIANALAAGREVTVHQANISFSGFTGAGYIIIDPDTGAGAYKISGGANGGDLVTSIASFLNIFSVSAHDDKAAGVEFLRLLIDFLASLLIEIFKSVLAGILKFLLDFLETFINLLAVCSGVQLIFVLYIYTVLTVLSLVLISLLFTGAFLIAALGTLAAFLINAFINDVVVPLICTSTASNRRKFPVYALVHSPST